MISLKHQAALLIMRTFGKRRGSLSISFWFNDKGFQGSDDHENFPNGGSHCLPKTNTRAAMVDPYSPTFFQCGNIQ